MPTSLNSGSIPKVRASSGMIGTMRDPSSLSRMRLRRMRAKTIVVETGVWLPASNSLSTASPGAGSGVARTTRLGIAPPSARRRSIRYSTSGDVGPGWKYGASLSLASGIGSWMRSRKTRSSFSESFFAWCVMLRASTPGPRVQPLTVLARMTVGAPLYSVAALYAAYSLR